MAGVLGAGGFGLWVGCRGEPVSARLSCEVVPGRVSARL